MGPLLKGNHIASYPVALQIVLLQCVWDRLESVNQHLYGLHICRGKKQQLGPSIATVSELCIMDTQQTINNNGNS